MELTAVIGAVGSLATLAIPSYGEHLARTQVAAAVERARAAGAEVTEHFAGTGVWPAALKAAPGGERVASVAITAGAGSTGPALTLAATLSRTDVYYAVAGKTIELATRDGGVTWVCRGGGLVPQYRPRDCDRDAD